MEQINVEKQHLNETLQKYDEFLSDTKLEFKNVYNLNTSKEEAQKRYNFLKNKIKTLETNINRPYFARIDFESNKGEKDVCYIGKVGVSNYDNEIVVVDWRAPISSLYYDSNIGNTEYLVDNHAITGKLLLKRQFEIQNRKLINYTDVDTVSNDEMLKPYLSNNADTRTKNIVSTIQKEQNEIIRHSIAKNLIIQGVAGSGKTTVALHRIAYLAYTYRNIIDNNQYMVIGPNKFFVNYISNILPELDVNDVKQFDLVELTENFIEEKLILEDEDNTINFYLNGNHSDLPKIKTSLKYKKIIDSFFYNYYKEIKSKKPIKINDFTIIDYSTIKKLWDECLTRNYDNLNAIVQRCTILLQNHFDEQKDSILTKLNKFIDDKIDSGIDINECRKERENIKTKILSNNKQIIKNYFKNMFKKTTVIYSLLKKEIKNYTTDNTLISSLDDKLYYEDLSALLYIHYKIYGFGDNDKYRHIVIDEAQDYNDFTFYALATIFPKASFSIYGDLAQSIYSYRSLNDWESVKENVFKQNMEIKKLNKSYRTTIEIMEEANKINNFLNLEAANAVIRHGENVQYIKLDNTISIQILLDDLQKKGYKNIAIISKDLKKSKDIYDQLSNESKIINIVSKNFEYSDGIYCIPCHLCKGLEFDAVIINEIDTYNIDSILDMKLLYVAMTRALHNLVVTYKNNLISILR